MSVDADLCLRPFRQPLRVSLEHLAGIVAQDVLVVVEEDIVEWLLRVKLLQRHALERLRVVEGRRFGRRSGSVRTRRRRWPNRRRDCCRWTRRRGRRRTLVTRVDRKKKNWEDNRPFRDRHKPPPMRSHRTSHSGGPGLLPAGGYDDHRRVLLWTGRGHSAPRRQSVCRLETEKNADGLPHHLDASCPAPHCLSLLSDDPELEPGIGRYDA